MKVTFITAHVGRKDPSDFSKYVRTWQMEDLPTAALAGLTPKDVDVSFFDERLEPINFDETTDLVAIHVEAYNAKRVYEIAAEYRKRKVPVILGGYHATIMPEETRKYADSILVGYAEGVWPTIVRDAEAGKLKRFYYRNKNLPMSFSMPNRNIFGKRNYLNVSCVETGRGCPLHCDFCTIQSATASQYYPRAISEIVWDIQSLKRKNVFFIDDNIVGNPKWAKELFKAITPLKINWFSQGTLSMAKDPELLELMAESGCIGLLIGFESLKKETLLEMRKEVNVPFVGNLKESVKEIHKHGLCIYGTFIFGYDSDTLADFRKTSDIAIDMGLFMAAFNPLIPFPGTPLYKNLLRQGRIPDPEWHLSPTFRFNDIPFKPHKMESADIYQACMESRKKFYKASGILSRMSNVSGNLNSLVKIFGYLYINNQLRTEIDEKDGLPLGNYPVRPEALNDSNVFSVLV